MLAFGPIAAHAAYPVATVEFSSWEQCDLGVPALGEAKTKTQITATPATCDKTAVSRDWSVDYYSFRAFPDTKDALLCRGVEVWNNDDCSGQPSYFLPFNGEPVVNGECLPDFLDPTYVSIKLDCFGFQ